MSTPAGAYRVHYVIGVENNPEEGNAFEFTFESYIQGAHLETADAVAQTTAEAMVTHVQSLYPTWTVNARRSYECRVPGDPWPVP